MLRTSRLLVIATALICLADVAALAGQQEPVKIVVAADYFSKYIWRGQNIDDKSVLQPAMSASAYGFTGSIWGNMDLTNKSQTAPDNAWEFSEFDYTLDYSAAVPGVERLNFSVGTIHYEFPNTAYKPTTEIYGGLTLGIPLSPSIKIYRDVDEIDGSYVQAGIGHTFEKLAVWSEKCYCGLQLGAAVGYGSSQYNKGYFGIDGGKFNDLTLSAGLCVQIGSWMVRPNVNYSTMLSGSIREATDKSDNLWCGVGLSTSF